MLRYFIIICIFISSLIAQNLKIGIDAYYPPFEYYNYKNQIIGFDVDLIEEISKRAKFDYTLINMDFEDIFLNLQSNEIDLAISSISKTKQREQIVDFSAPYFYTKNVYIKLQKNSKIKHKDDLIGKKIGVQAGTTQEAVVSQIKNAKVVTSKYFATNISALRYGKIDAIVVDQIVGLEYIKQNPSLSVFYEENNDEQFCIAFAKGKFTDLIEKINQALDEIRADGTYDKLLAKYKLGK